MSNISTEALAKGGFALVQTPVKRGSDGKSTLQGAKAFLDGQTLDGNAIESGRVQWFPKEALTFKGAKYKAMDRLVAELGVSWGAGKLIPLSRLNELMARFAQLSSEFFDSVDALESEYDRLIDEHAARQPPAVQDVIERVRQPWDTFRSSFKEFLPTPSVFNPISDDLDDVRDQIVDATQLDIADEAQELVEKVLGKEKVDPRSIPPIRRLVEKCRNFGIINAGFRCLAEVFDDFERELVPPIEGAKREQLEKYLLLLASTDATAAYIANAKATEDESILDDVFGGTAVVMAAPAAPVLQEVTPTASASWDDWESVAL